MEVSVTTKQKVVQPPWIAPSGDGLDKGLKVLNSLTSTKIPFVPASGNRVTWYICGPTVYDSSHFGHARNYVTFDVIRRILSDYFNYDVFSVMNITDVDDKIILRARKNYLLKLYEEEHKTITPVLFSDAREAYELYAKKQAKKRDEFEKEKEKWEKKGKKGKADEAAAEIKLIEEFVAQIPLALEAIDALEKSGETNPQKLFGVGPTREVLADLVDIRKGSEVTDEAIFRQHASKFENDFLEDMRSLGVRMPDVMTRVTEYVPQVIDFVQKIIAQGFAYESNESVYFDVNAFQAGGYPYAKLEPWSVGNATLMSEGEGALTATSSEKRAPNDFALWKKSKPGEPRWNSPWGLGRPGWHIECSAMAGDILGPNMDIHSGGSDLKFPHHDNELAQSEACFGCKQWVNYFLHSGHLHIDGLKMSKSKKNFVTIREMLASGVSPRQIRLYFLTQFWHQVMDFDRKKGLDAIKNKEKTLARFFEQMNKYREASKLEENQSWTKKEVELHNYFMGFQDRVHAAMCDNFNTPEVLLQLFEIVTKTNDYIAHTTQTEYPGGARALLLTKLANYVARILGIFGLDFPEYGLAAGASASTGDSDRKDLIDVIVSLRLQLREVNKKQFNPELLAITDQLRDEIMPNFGVRIIDNARLVNVSDSWSPADPLKLKQEIADNKRVAEEKAREKKQKRLEQLRRDITGWEAKSQPPNQLLRTEEFSAWDERGFPTHSADGKELPSSKKKTLEKKFSTHVANYKKYEDSIAKDPAFLDKLRAEAAALESELPGKQVQ